MCRIDRPRRAVSIGRSPSASPGYAVTGLYFYDNQVLEHRRVDQAVARAAELEITDVNQLYLQANALTVEVMGCGTPGSTPAPMNRCSRLAFHRDLESGRASRSHARKRSPIVSGGSRRGRSSVWRRRWQGTIRPLLLRMLKETLLPPTA